MSWFEAAKTEFDKLPKGGKIAVGGIVLLVAGIAFYEYMINRGQSASVSSVAGTPTNATAQGVGGLSALDTQSLAQSIAGLVNAQQTPGPQGPAGPIGPQGNPGPQTPPTQPGPVQAVIGSIDPFSRVTRGGVDSRGQRYWFNSPGTPSNQQGSLLFVPVGSQINQGSQGRIWLQTPGGAPQLLTSQKPMGGGPISTSVPSSRATITTETHTTYQVLEGRMIATKQKVE